MKLNKSKWFVAIIGVFLISLNSCQTEEIALQESEKKVQHIDIDKLFQDSNFNNSFNKIVPKKNKSNQKFSKTIMEEQYGFTIIDQPVSVITNENLISYTLLIDKQNKETAETVYNLVIQVNKQTNEVKSSIIKYISTYPIFNFNDFKGEIKIEPITYNAAQSSKLIYDCIQVTYYVCANANENHVAGGPGCDALPKTKTACGYSNDSSGTSSTNIGSGDLSGGGGSGSFTTAPVINYYYYTPNKNTDGNYLNLTNEQISFINSESVDRLLRKFIIDYYNPEISPEISASQVVDFLKNNQHLLVDINNYIIQNNSLENQDFLLQITNLANTEGYTAQEITNWFLTKTEGSEGDVNPNLIDDLSNLNYQSRTMPSYSSFVNAFPKLPYPGFPGYYDKMPAKDVYNLVGGELKSLYINSGGDNGPYRNACAIRWSLAMNILGFLIPKSKITKQGADKNNIPQHYLIQAVSAADFMQKTFGDPNYKLEGSKANNPSEVAKFLKGKFGIYVIVNNDSTIAGYTGHIDLIQNGHIPGGANASNVPGGIKYIKIWSFN